MSTALREARPKPPPPVAGLDWDINHLLGYGQSLSTGQECWPALTPPDENGCLMLGGSVHSRDPNRSTDWQPQLHAGSLLQPLAATVTDYLGTLLSREAQATLPPGAQHLGETPLESAARALQHGWRSQGAGGRRHVLVSSCGVSGKTIEELSADAKPHYFGRLASAVRVGKEAAAGQTYGVAAILFVQGEYNYLGLNGGTRERETYRAALARLHRDVLASVMTITGQALPPAFILAQTGAGFTVDDCDLAIGEAQVEFAAATPGVWLAAPYYPVTDKGGHLDSNGARWLGFQFGKVLQHVLLDRQHWKPVQPSRIRGSGRVVIAEFSVPHPPLVFDTPYDTIHACTWPTRGFAVQDEGGSIAIQSIDVAGNAVTLQLGRDLVGRASLRYASKATFNGNGMLRDSDPAQALDTYVYHQGSGQYAAADLPRLVGQPYPLWNWSVAFCRPIETVRG